MGIKYEAKAMPFDAEDFLARVGEGRTMATYRRNQRIFSQGDPADAVYYIQAGRVKLTTVSRRGKEAVLAVLGPNAFFGERCLVRQSVRLENASALTKCSVVRIGKQAMLDVLSREPRFRPVSRRISFPASCKWKRIWSITC